MFHKKEVADFKRGKAKEEVAVVYFRSASCQACRKGL
jgi:hypothetical protein